MQRLYDGFHIIKPLLPRCKADRADSRKNVVTLCMDQAENDIKRVVLIGAESTGKTTLAEALAAHYETVWAPEYLREFVEQKGALPEPSDSRLIAEGHLAQEATFRPQAHRVLFLDTDLISTCVYHRYYFGTTLPWLERRAAERSADLYLLTDIDIPWTPDPGQRDGPAVRAALHAFFLDELLARSLPHVLVSGSTEARMETALRAVKALFETA